MPRVSWRQFHKEVDDVIPLAIQAPPHVETQKSACLRVTTRGQQKANENKLKASPRSEAEPSRSEPWICRYSAEEMSMMQQDDSDLSPVYKWLKSQERCTRDESSQYSPATRKLWMKGENLCMLNEVMYQRWLASNGHPKRLQLLVPYILREDVLTECYSSVFSAHFSIEKSTQNVKRRFYWYRLSRDVKRHILECPVCDANKHPHRPLKAALGDFRVGAPMDRVGIDIMVPLPISEKGNTCILVVADYFTRWIKAYPLPDQQAKTVARTFVN